MGVRGMSEAEEKARQEDRDRAWEEAMRIVAKYWGVE